MKKYLRFIFSHSSILDEVLKQLPTLATETCTSSFEITPCENFNSEYV